MLEKTSQNNFATDTSPDYESVASQVAEPLNGITLSEAANNIREFRARRSNPEQYENDPFLDLAILQNQEFVDRYRPTTLGELYDKYSVKFRFPEFKFPKLGFDIKDAIGKVLLFMPALPIVSLAMIFQNLNLRLNMPRNILQMKMLKYINKFNVSDISPSFNKYLRETNNSIFFMTDPIYEKYIDEENLAPSENISERMVRLNESDIPLEDRSLTLKTKKLRQSGGKMYLPLGIVYSNNIEKDELSGLIPTRVEIITKKGKTIIPEEMTMVSNGQIYVNHDQKIKISEVHIIYGKPSKNHITRNLKFGENQDNQTGLASETSLTKDEVIFRNYLRKNKTKEEGSNLSQEGSLNKILEYMKNHYLRYSLLDTVKTGERVNNARRALQHRRTSCLGAACVAKTFIDTYKFTPRFKTKSGILSGFVFNLHEVNEEKVEYPINMDQAHAITLAQLGEHIRIYDITPEILSKPQRVERKIESFVKNTNHVYKAIKRLFLRDGGDERYPEYKKILNHNLRIYRDIKHYDFPLDQNNFVEKVIETTLSQLFSRHIIENFYFELNTNDDNRALRFPFSLVSRREIQHKAHDAEDRYRSSTRNNSENSQILKRFGINIDGSSIFRRFLPVSKEAVDILKKMSDLREETGPGLMAILIDSQKVLAENLEIVLTMKKFNQSANDSLNNLLVNSQLDIDKEAFSKISWLDLMFMTGELRNTLMNDELNLLSSRFDSEDSASDVLSLAKGPLTIVERQFDDFLRDKSKEIIQIFSEPNQDISLPQERLVSSTFLWSLVASDLKNTTDADKKLRSYIKIKKKLGELFLEYYNELSAKGNPALLE